MEEAAVVAKSTAGRVVAVVVEAVAMVEVEGSSLPLMSLNARRFHQIEEVRQPLH